MTARPDHKLETHFEVPGSLPPPRFIGRAVRLLVGLWLLHFLYQLITEGDDIFLGTSPPNHWAVWVSTIIGLALTPYVVNIGFSRNWRHWPRLAVIAAAILLAGIDLVVFGSWWALPLGMFSLIWFLYWSSHLGLSFVLSALIATPGCEMRAIPHLWTLVTGRPTKEHSCPGALDRLDRWERERSRS